MNKIKIIGISGKIGSGKTTFSNIMADFLKNKGYKVMKKNFADKLRDVVEMLFGYRGETQEEKNIEIGSVNLTIGELLQQIGTNLREVNKDIWVYSALSNIEEDVVCIIGDCRFKNEANIIKKMGGIVVRLNGDPVGIRSNSSRDLEHISETDLDDYKEFDIIFDNTQSLRALYNLAEFITLEYF